MALAFTVQCIVLSLLINYEVSGQFFQNNHSKLNTTVIVCRSIIQIDHIYIYIE